MPGVWLSEITDDPEELIAKSGTNGIYYEPGQPADASPMEAIM